MMDGKLIEYILLCVLFYLIGSIPTSYLFLKFKTGKDITTEGSGNPGALNYYEVSGSRLSGVLVLLIDFLKGFLPAFLFYNLAGFPFDYLLLPLVLIIAGHNFSVWLKFKGGRGLATAAGLSVAVCPALLIAWCVMFVIAYGVYRKVHFGNITATVLLPVFALLLGSFDTGLNGAASRNFGAFFSFTAIMSLLILLRHVKPFFALIRGHKNRAPK